MDVYKIIGVSLAVILVPMVFLTLIGLSSAYLRRIKENREEREEDSEKLKMIISYLIMINEKMDKLESQINEK